MSKFNPTEDRTWFGFTAAKGSEPAEILIYDYIGSFGVSATAFDLGLKAIGKVTKANLRVNSPGGDTPTAASIYNMLERWKAKYSVELTVIIDGIAASAASWIAMLGDEVVMPENTLMMIHDPSGFAVGTSRDMKTMASVLERIKQGMVSAYMKKSGLSEEEVSTIMEDETWYSAQEAVDAGFADRVDNPIEIAASFDLTRFKHPPDGPGDGRTPTGAIKEKDSMSNPAPKAETVVEMEARIRAELTASLPPKPTVTPAPAAVTETPADMEARIRSGILNANAEISSLCLIAGHPELAATYVAQAKTPAEVRLALEAVVKTQAAAPAAADTALNTHVQGAMPDPNTVKDLTAKGIDASAIWANYNKGGKGTPVAYQK